MHENRICCFHISPTSGNSIYLTPKVVCSNVMIPDVKNNVPVISLRPTWSSFMHRAGARRIGTVRVATNIDM